MLSENYGKQEIMRIASLEEYPITVPWRVKFVDHRFPTEWDDEFFYHFKSDIYENVEWLELKVDDEERKRDIDNKLRKLNVIGEVLENSIMIYFYEKD